MLISIPHLSYLPSSPLQSYMKNPPCSPITLRSSIDSYCELVWQHASHTGVCKQCKLEKRQNTIVRDNRCKKDIVANEEGERLSVQDVCHHSTHFTKVTKATAGKLTTHTARRLDGCQAFQALTQPNQRSYTRFFNCHMNRSIFKKTKRERQH